MATRKSTAQAPKTDVAFVAPMVETIAPVVGPVAAPVVIDEPTPVAVESWYSRQHKSYVTRIVDQNGEQVGDANYDGTKADRNASALSLSKQVPGQAIPGYLDGSTFVAVAPPAEAPKVAKPKPVAKPKATGSKAPAEAKTPVAKTARAKVAPSSIPAPERKTCRVCGVEQPIADFSKKASQRDGYATTCKSCDRAWALTHRPSKTQTAAPVAITPKATSKTSTKTTATPRKTAKAASKSSSATTTKG